MRIISITKTKEILKEQKADFTIVENQKPIYSVSDSLEYYNLAQTAPVFIISTDIGIYALIISGENYPISFDIVLKALQCTQAKLLPRSELFEITGYKSGSVPLVGLDIPCILDKKLLGFPYVYGGIGDANYTLKINPYDLKRINNTVSLINF